MFGDKGDFSFGGVEVYDCNDKAIDTFPSNPKTWDSLFLLFLIRVKNIHNTLHLIHNKLIYARSI